MKTNRSEILAALTGAALFSLPFLADWWLYGLSGNPGDTASWLYGVPALAIAPVAGLFGALAGLWARADLKRLWALLKHNTEQS